MDGEPPSIQQKDAFWIYKRRILPLMIMTGISFIVMEIFLGLALVSQLNTLKWLTWVFDATFAVLCCTTIVWPIRLLRLMIKRRGGERKEKQPSTI